MSVGGIIVYDQNVPDQNVPEIRLSVNIDGLPLYRISKGKALGRLLGCIDDYPVWVIGSYHGVKKTVCPNKILQDFVSEVKRLQIHGITLNNIVYRFKLQKMLMDAPARAPSH